MIKKFEEKYPFLFHVTRRSAVGNIKHGGLRSPLLIVSGLDDKLDIHLNRQTWTKINNAEGAEVWLRWQRLHDHLLLKRLPATITPSEWRRFINTMVFFFPRLREAETLKGAKSEEGIEQVVLAFRTSSLIEAGCKLRVCKWNNGYPDRSKPIRLRSFSDYRPVEDWRLGDKVQEVTAFDRVPAGVPFEIVT